MQSLIYIIIFIIVTWSMKVVASLQNGRIWLPVAKGLRQEYCCYDVGQSFYCVGDLEHLSKCVPEGNWWRGWLDSTGHCRLAYLPVAWRRVQRWHCVAWRCSQLLTESQWTQRFVLWIWSHQHTQSICLWQRIWKWYMLIYIHADIHTDTFWHTVYRQLMAVVFDTEIEMHTCWNQLSAKLQWLILHFSSRCCEPVCVWALLKWTLGTCIFMQSYCLGLSHHKKLTAIN